MVVRCFWHKNWEYPQLCVFDLILLRSVYLGGMDP